MTITIIVNNLYWSQFLFPSAMIQALNQENEDLKKNLSLASSTQNELKVTQQINFKLLVLS